MSNQQQTAVTAAAHANSDVAAELAITYEMLSTIELADLDAMALSGKTSLLIADFDRRPAVPKLAGGWKCHLITPGREGSKQHVFILVPAEAREREIWVQGQVHLAVTNGLNEKQAKAWVESRVAKKHKVLRRLAQAMKVPALKAAYMAFNKDCSEEQYQQWLTQHNIRDKIDASQRAAIADLVRELDMAERKINPAMAKMLDGIVIQPKEKPNHKPKNQNQQGNKPAGEGQGKKKKKKNKKKRGAAAVAASSSTSQTVGNVAAPEPVVVEKSDEELDAINGNVGTHPSEGVVHIRTSEEIDEELKQVFDNLTIPVDTPIAAESPELVGDESGERTV